MGVWNWVRGSGTPPQVEAEDGDFVFDKTIDIAARNFIGMCSRSPNNRFTIAWVDGGPDQARTGRYLLLDGKAIVAEGTMPRPNDGKVADNGAFLLNDWGSPEILSGTLSAFAPDGRVLFTRRFAANLYDNALSPDGRYAVCQTANAPGEDGNRLTLFDLEAGREIVAFQPESGWAKSYEFYPEARRLRFLYHDGGAFDYGFDGTFIDRMRWLAFGLQKGDLLVIEKLIAEGGSKLPPTLAEQLLPATDIALRNLRADDGRSRARVLKSRGICLEAVAEVKHALACYDEALSLDPKVGVKRRADALRKVL
ncbi:tetratricopeptide repeat protein [Bradyrhizobium sp. 18]|uniref:tetratricopeptide repeat protein n=1 Tax=Bradyrhizobium sp. 18 TaxID=2782657 RepID=UPI001FF9A6EF|nr:tetratricopeptide repeat protein [Bradyrhizobium sp. 18]MCK1504566.1 tetratricopeptide repeat protein [Bradyrhizobium sp. 18]